MLVVRPPRVPTYARTVIAIDLDAANLGRIRMAISPTFEAPSLLSLAVTGRVHPVVDDLRHDARHAMRYPDVRMLAQLVSGYPGYVPDFLTPKPTAGRPAEILRNQIDAVAETPLDIVAANLASATATGVHLPHQVRRAVDDGTLTRRAANGLDQFWRATFAPRWPELRNVLERDIADRARMLAQDGISRVLRTLHSRLRWDGATLRIGISGDETSHAAGEELVLIPSVLGWPHLFSQVIDPTNAYVCYPAARVGTAIGRDRSGPGDGVGGPAEARRQALDELLGQSRASVLLDLDQPRTTTQLSSRRQLAPATVSYHLGALVSAGLVLRKREGRQVSYNRTTYGDLLLEAVFGSAD
jgi:DNA-binding transcriptional ArsR family regulator